MSSYMNEDLALGILEVVREASKIKDLNGLRLRIVNGKLEHLELNLLDTDTFKEDEEDDEEEFTLDRIRKVKNNE